MTTPISERLRTEVNIGSCTVTPFRREAADVIDALVATLEAIRTNLIRIDWEEESLMIEDIDIALAQARHT